MENYICIHAHFYQPPRENPWLEAIERQKSAHPYHDWNQRITAECYQPNSMARILDSSGPCRDRGTWATPGHDRAKAIPVADQRVRLAAGGWRLGADGG